MKIALRNKISSDFENIKSMYFHFYQKFIICITIKYFLQLFNLRALIGYNRLYYEKQKMELILKYCILILYINTYMKIKS